MDTGGEGGDWEEDGEVALAGAGELELELGGCTVGAEGAAAAIGVGATGVGGVVGAGAEDAPPATGAVAGDWAMAGTRRARSKTRAGIMALVHRSISSHFLLVGVIGRKREGNDRSLPFSLSLSFFLVFLGGARLIKGDEEQWCVYIGKIYRMVILRLYSFLCLKNHFLSNFLTMSIYN